MRAWSAKQRFPVAQWVKQLDELYSESIRIHNKEAKKRKVASLSPSPNATRPSSRGSTATYVEPGSGLVFSPGSDANLASPSHPSAATPRTLMTPDLPTPSAPWAGGSRSNSPRASVASSIGASLYANAGARESTISVDSFAIRAQKDGMASPGLMPEYGLAPPRPTLGQNHRNSSLLSLPDVVGDRHDLKLQQVDQFFNDTNGEYYAMYEELLDDLTAQNSSSELCIEAFLKKSEKEWFTRYRDAKLGRNRESRLNSPVNSRPASRNEGRNESVVSRGRQRRRSITPSSSLARSVFEVSPPPDHHIDDEFLLGDGYQAPTGLKK